jgi:hypothetical protein
VEEDVEAMEAVCSERRNILGLRGMPGSESRQRGRVDCRLDRAKRIGQSWLPRHVDSGKRQPGPADSAA